MRLLPMIRRRPASSSALTVSVDATAPSRAGWVTGDIALPVSALWGDSAMAAGVYTLVVPSWSPLAVVHVQGDDHDAVVFAASVRGRPDSRASEITLVPDGTTFRVRSLELRDPGIIFYFDAPRAVPAPYVARGRRGSWAATGLAPSRGSAEVVPTIGV